MTGRDILKRLSEHKNTYNRDITGWYILAEFNNKRDALDFERKFQEENNANGLVFTDDWRKMQSEKAKRLRPSMVNSRKVQCIDTGEIFESIRDCARYFESCSGNLTRHLNGHPRHGTFKKLKFRYYEE